MSTTPTFVEVYRPANHAELAMVRSDQERDARAVITEALA